MDGLEYRFRLFEAKVDQRHRQLAHILIEISGYARSAKERGSLPPTWRTTSVTTNTTDTTDTHSGDQVFLRACLVGLGVEESCAPSCTKKNCATNLSA